MLIKHPGFLLKFWNLGVSNYLRWAFIRSWHLSKFSPFSAKCRLNLICDKTVCNTLKIYNTLSITIDKANEQTN